MHSHDRREVVAFLPCRAGSQRVPRKNTRPFGGRSEGLIDIKIAQLIECLSIDRIVVSTNDPYIYEAAESAGRSTDSRVEARWRPEHLCTPDTSTDELIRYVPEIIQSGHVLWTHVTSPFFGKTEYEDIIRAYFESVEAGTHDSIMAVTKIQSFIWDQTGPLNYDKSHELWPRTQTLKPIYEVNSAAFIVSLEIMKNIRDRITENVYLYEVEKAKAMDIDWEEDFELASKIYSLR